MTKTMTKPLALVLIDSYPFPISEVAFREGKMILRVDSVELNRSISIGPTEIVRVIGEDGTSIITDRIDFGYVVGRLSKGDFFTLDLPVELEGRTWPSAPSD